MNDNPTFDEAKAELLKCKRYESPEQKQLRAIRANMEEILKGYIRRTPTLTDIANAQPSRIVEDLLGQPVPFQFRDAVATQENEMVVVKARMPLPVERITMDFVINADGVCVMMPIPPS